MQRKWCHAGDGTIALPRMETRLFGPRWRAALAHLLPAKRRSGTAATAAKERNRSPLPDRVCALFFIANFAQLVDADGPEVAAGVSREIRRRIRASLLASADTDLSCLRDDCFLLRIHAACTVGGSAPAQRSGGGQLEELLANLGREPLKVRGMTALPRLHADWIAMRASRRMGAAEIELALWAAQERLAPDVVVDCVDRVYDVHVEKKAGRLWLRGRALHEAEEQSRIEALFRLLQADCK
ncbi:hypothetical protein [Variovorax paradoxus]|uniref:hypothetical protein n=1 Tax=Variovorax paradoxus TaxID=34073 RepID=UPI0029C88468|nr:hypothetical protein RZE77_30685 [Variovorax paradoxus]